MNIELTVSIKLCGKQNAQLSQRVFKIFLTHTMPDSHLQYYIVN